MATRTSNKNSSDKKNSDDKKKVVVKKNKETKTSSRPKESNKPVAEKSEKKLGSSIDRLIKSIADKVRGYRNSGSKDKPEKKEYTDTTEKKLQNKNSAKNAGKENTKENSGEEDRGTTKDREEVRRITPRGGISFGGSRGRNTGSRGGHKNPGKQK
jgi:hypothetical protein